MSQNSEHLCSTQGGSSALANVGYLGSAAVISLAAFRSDARAVKSGAEVFSAFLRAGCKENRAAFLELATGHCLV